EPSISLPIRTIRQREGAGSMERILKALVFFAALPAFAGTSFAPPPRHAGHDASDGYSESRFGYAPARVEVSSEADYWDSTSSSQAAGNRAPAGLVVDGDPNAPVVPSNGPKNGRTVKLKSLPSSSNAPRRI